MPLFEKRKGKERSSKKDERRRMYAWIKMEWETEFYEQNKKIERRVHQIMRRWAKISMKKLASVIFMFVILAAFSGVAAAADKQLTVAGVVFQEDQFMRLLQIGFQTAAEAAGARFIPGNTNGDAGREAEMLQTYISQEYDGLAISPISEVASFKVLQDAAEAGLKIGVANHLFDERSLPEAFRPTITA